MLIQGIFLQKKTTHILFLSSLHKFISTTVFRTSINDSLVNDDFYERVKGYCNFLKNAHQTSDLYHGKSTHAHLNKNCFFHSSIMLQNFVLNMYVKFGDLESALQVFDEMPQRNVVSWSSLITGLVRYGYSQKGFSYFSCMLGADVRPNHFTLVGALNACSFFDGLVKAFQVYALVIKLGFEWNVFVKNAFLTALIRNGQFKDSLKAFDECLVKDIVSWNAMINGCLLFASSDVPSFWLRMIRDRVKPDEYTFSTAFSAVGGCGDDKFGAQLHCQLVKVGHGDETGVGNSLVDMYLKFGDLVHGVKAFHEIRCKNVLSWTVMATGYLDVGAPRKALQLLGDMKMAGVRPNRFSLAATFRACANMASLEEGEKAHCLRLKLGSEMDVCVDNALLDMYVKCGCIDNAMTVFRRMKDHTTVTLSTIVMGLARNGHALEALRIFDEMVMAEGLEPNYITFVCVLYACSQGGLVEEGWKYFSSMTDEYGISPGEDHFVCMIDLLGRTGHIKEAEKLISNMPFKQGPIVWKTLLGACNNHGDFEAAKLAAESAMTNQQSDPSTYVLLSNMFAGINHWEGAKTLRDMMKTKSLNKVQGTSSI